MGYFYTMKPSQARAGGHQLTAEESAGLLGGESARFVREAASAVHAADDHGDDASPPRLALICGRRVR